MWTVTLGASGGVSSGLISSALAVVTDAANTWGQYLSFAPGAVIDIRVDFEDLDGTTLAESGPSFFFDRSVGGRRIFQAGTLIELNTGGDPNGTRQDITITIDSQRLITNGFHLGLSTDPGPPSNRTDLYTVLLHEIGHGLGFLSFDDPSSNDISTFEFLVSGTTNRVFNGPAAIAAYGGPVPLNSDGSHLRDSGQILSASIASGRRLALSATELAILKDIGAPVKGPTSGADLLYGFEAADAVSLLAGNDTYFGLGGADTVFGGPGGDTIDGGAGNDILNGEDGDDIFIDGAGGDRFDGGAGFDTVRFDSRTSAITINLNDGFVSSPSGQPVADQLISIEQLFLTAFNDQITGAASADTFHLGGGDDIADGGGGADDILGGGGRDTIAGGAGADRLRGEAGDDQLSGGLDNDTLEGGDGNDLLDGGAGADTISGGAGTDVATYRNAAAGVVYNALSPGAGAGDGAGDVIAADVELIEGSAFGDTFVGNGAANTFNGAQGADQLFGNAGLDRLDGGDGFALSAFGSSVYRLYEATLDRPPDVPGFNSWQGALASGQSLVSIASGFVNSIEFQTVYGPLDNTAFVTLLYNNVLDRAPDGPGLANWTGLLNSGSSRESVVIGFSESVEFITNSAFDAAAFATNVLYGAASGQIFRIYQVTLDRQPDEGGFIFHTGRIAAGVPLDSVVSGFVGSVEFQTVYGSLNDTDFVTLLYNNALDRAPDPAGLASWLDLLASGASRDNVVLGFSESPEFIANTNAALNSYLETGLPSLADTLDGGLGDDALFGGRGPDTFFFLQTEAGDDDVFGFEASDTIALTGFGYADPGDAFAHLAQTGADVIFADQGQTITFHNTTLASVMSANLIFI